MPDDDQKQKAGFLTGKKAPAPVKEPESEQAPAPVQIDPASMVGFLKKGGDQKVPVSPVPGQPAAAPANNAAPAANTNHQPAPARAPAPAARAPAAAPRAAAAPAARAPAPVHAPVQAPVAGDRATAEAHLHKGLDHYDRQETDQAFAEYQACVQADPSFSMGHNNLGMVLIDMERYDEAIAELYESIRCDPQYAEAYNNLGFVLRRMQRHVEAACAYRVFLELEPDVEEGSRIQGWMDTVVRDNKLTELPPFSIPGTAAAPPPEPEPAPPPEQPKAKIKKMAAWEVAAGNVATAAPINILGEVGGDDVLKTASALPSTPKPNLAGLVPPAGAAPAARARPPSVQAAAVQPPAPRTRPPTVQAPAIQAPAPRSRPPTVLAAAVNPPSTRPPTVMAAAVNPPSTRPPTVLTAAVPAQTDVIDLIELGMTAFGEGDLDKAAEEFKRAIELAPENAEAHAGLGRVLVRKENFEHGLEELRIAAQYDPSDPAPWYVIGFTLRAVERNVEASEAYEGFLKLMPDALDAPKMREWITRIKGPLGVGGAAEDTILDDEQIVTETDKKYKRALTHFQDGDLDTSLRECVKILNEDPAHFRTRVLLGRIYLRQKSYDNAIEQLEGALVTRPDYPEALYFLGQAAEKRGSLDIATTSFRRYLEVTPQGPRAERLNEWLLSHTAGDAAGASQMQCELCLRFFPGSEISQHEGKATCRNCLVVMGAAPSIQAPVPASKAGTSTAGATATELPVASGRSKLIAAVLVLALLGGGGGYMYKSHMLDPLLIKYGLMQAPKVVVPDQPKPVEPEAAQFDTSHIKISNEPALQVFPYATWTYTPTLEGTADVDAKAKDWTAEYFVTNPQAGMEFKDKTLLWIPSPAEYGVLKNGQNYPITVKIRGAYKRADGRKHEIFSVSKTFTLSCQFGYETSPEQDLQIAPTEPVALAAADLNGDGLPDIVAASGQFRHGALRLYINRGEAQFGGAAVLADKARFSAVWAGSLEGDKNGILAANWFTGEITPYFLDNNQPVAGKSINLGSGPVAVTAANMDSSKTLYVAALLGVGHSIAIAPLTPDRKFGAVSTVQLPSSGGQGYLLPWESAGLGPGFLAITPLSDAPLQFAPFNKGEWGKGGYASGGDLGLIGGAAVLRSGPGKPARLALASSTGRNAQVVLMEEKNGIFTVVGHPIELLTPAVGLLAGDFNQDGQDDLLVINADECALHFCDPASPMLYPGPIYKPGRMLGPALTLPSRSGSRPDMLLLNESGKAVILKSFEPVKQ